MNDLSNRGERLVPGYSHDLLEVIRHRSSYNLFLHIIENDVKNNKLSHVNILDIGCGVGHGTHLLSSIACADIIGIDVSPDAIRFAEENFKAKNIAYKCIDFNAIDTLTYSFDYIVSRHSLEHIKDGIGRALNFNVDKRILINVPYREIDGNEFHFYTNITEDDFQSSDTLEFLFEDMNGITHKSSSVPNINSIVCIASKPSYDSVLNFLALPFPSWNPNFAESLAYGELPELQRIVAKTQTALAHTQSELGQAQAELSQAQAELSQAQAELYEALRVLDHPVVRFQRKVWQALKFWK